MSEAAAERLLCMPHMMRDSAEHAMIRLRCAACAARHGHAALRCLHMMFMIDVMFMAMLFT